MARGTTNQERVQRDMPADGMIRSRHESRDDEDAVVTIRPWRNTTKRGGPDTDRDISKEEEARAIASDGVVDGRWLAVRVCMTVDMPTCGCAAWLHRRVSVSCMVRVVVAWLRSVVVFLVRM